MPTSSWDGESSSGWMGGSGVRRDVVCPVLVSRRSLWFFVIRRAMDGRYGPLPCAGRYLGSVAQRGIGLLRVPVPLVTCSI